jgi:hypothetical protein
MGSNISNPSPMESSATTCERFLLSKQMLQDTRRQRAKSQGRIDAGMKFAFHAHCFGQRPRNTSARQYVTQIDSVNIVGAEIPRYRGAFLANRECCSLGKRFDDG